MTDATAVRRIGELGIVPVVVIEDANRAHDLGQALKAGGLPCAEVTLRTDAALEALRILAEDPDLLIGAGTVTRPEQVGLALAAGARYIVSPGFSAAVVRECATAGVPVLPGIATATEIQTALDAGLDVVKFFPAEVAGGAAAVKALSAPFLGVRFVPTGGIGLANITPYVRLPSVLAIGGSWLVAADLLEAGDFARVTQLSADAVALVAQIRGER